MPTIKKYESKNGETRYQFKIYLGKDPLTGKDKNTTRRGFKTKTEATKAIRELQAGVQTVETKRVDMSFADVHAKWREQYRLKVRESTFKQVDGLFNHNFLPAFGAYRIGAITHEECQRLVNSMAHKHQTWRKMILYLNLVFKFAVIKDIIDSNPMDKVDLNIKINDSQVKNDDDDDLKFYSKHELQKFLEACKEDSDPRVHIFFRLLAFTGLRRGECLALTWSDFNLDSISWSNIEQQLEENENVYFDDSPENLRYALRVNKTLSASHNGVHIQAPKNNKSRIISLDPITVEILEDYNRKYHSSNFTNDVDLETLQALSGDFGWELSNEKGLLFPNRDRNYIALSKSAKWIERVSNRADMRKITTHQFRHTHCSLLVEAGVGLKEASVRLGHSDIQTTANIYAHVSKQVNRDVADKFSSYVGF